MSSETEEFRWDEQRRKDNEAFRDLLNRKAVREKLFGEKFIDALERRRDALDERARKLTVIQLTLSLLLAVSVIVPELSVGVFGLTSKAGNFREFLLVLTGSLPLYGMLASIEQSRITDAMHIFLQKQADGDKDTLRVLALRYGILIDLKVPELIGKKVSKLRKITFGIGAVGVAIWIVVTALAFISLEFVVMVSILMTPTVSLTLSLFVCLYVLLINISNFGIRAATGISSVAASPIKIDYSAPTKEP
jgi:hypothetical protein